jgi:PAS domain-containing protein
MFLSRHTVDYHLRQIYRRLEVDSRVALATQVHESSGAEFAMFDGVLDGVTVIAPLWDSEGKITDFRIVYANDASTDVAGRRVADFVGRRLRDCYPGVTLDVEFARVFTSGEPLDLRDFQSAQTVNGLPSPCRFRVRATRHGGVVAVANRIVDPDGDQTR